MTNEPAIVTAIREAYAGRCPNCITPPCDALVACTPPCSACGAETTPLDAPPDGVSEWHCEACLRANAWWPRHPYRPKKPTDWASLVPESARQRDAA